MTFSYVVYILQIYSILSTTFSYHQRSFLLQQREHIQRATTRQNAKNETMWNYSALNDMSPSPPLSGLSAHNGRGGGKNTNARKDGKHQLNTIDAYMN